MGQRRAGLYRATLRQMVSRAKMRGRAQTPVPAIAILTGANRTILRDHLVEEFGELHCKLGHAVRIEPGLRRRSPKNGNISSIRRRLAANPSRK
jgi:hypothetical protein